MKKILSLILLAMIVVLGLGTTVNAYTLELRGTDTLGNRLIYDPDLNITWYDFSNDINTWDSQVAWASGLSVTFGGDIFDDWRLPMTVDGTTVSSGDPSFYNGTGPNGYNITSSEMGHLFYTELGNKGFYDTSGNEQPGWGLTNTGDFQNLISNWYWSGTEYSANTNAAWNFYFSHGNQNVYNKLNNYYGLAVRSGDVAAATSVPEPTTVALLGIGLAGMAVYGVRRRRRLRPQVK